MSESVEYEPLLCWCFKHENPALMYPDGSTSCMYWLIVESSGECTIGTVPQKRLARKAQIRAARPGVIGQHGLGRR